MRAFDYAAGQPWAILADPTTGDSPHLKLILDIAQRAHEPDFEAVAMRQADRTDGRGMLEMRGGVAVLNIIGPIFRYGNLFTRISGATSLDELATRFGAALDDQKVKAILLNVDSPGGEVAGISEFAAEIFRARERKPIVAYADNMAASAAYWLSAAAGRISATDTAEVGSIGVVATLVKRTGEDRGYKTFEFVSTQSPNKRPDLETDDGRAQIQKRIDDLGAVFVSAIAQYRGVKEDTVLSDFGRGGVLIAERARAAGMIDSIATFDEVVRSLNADGARSKFVVAAGGPAAISPKEVSAMENPTRPAGENPAVDPKPNPAPPTAAAPAPTPTPDPAPAAPAAAAETEEIIALCAIAGLPAAKALDFINQKKSAKDVRAALLEMRASEGSKTEIISQLQPQSGAEDLTGKKGAMKPGALAANMEKLGKEGI